MKKPAGRPKKEQRLVRHVFRLEKADKEAFLKMFEGIGSQMLAMFVKEAISGKPRLVFEMDYKDRPNPKNDPLYGMSVAQIDPKTNKIVKAYRSVREAGSETGFSFASIARHCRGEPIQKKVYKGFKWKYI